jgi:hypothetical protein
MTIRFTAALLWVAIAAAPVTRAAAQGADKPVKQKKADKEKKTGADSAAIPPLFTSEAPLAVTFTANWGRLRDDKSETSPYRAATMSYTAADGKTVTVPLKVKTHGIWRLKHCVLPPLRLSFSNKEAKQTVFYDLQKPKMVSACRDNDSYDHADQPSRAPAARQLRR